MNSKSNSKLNTQSYEQIQFKFSHNEYKYMNDLNKYNADWITYDLKKFISKNGEITYSKEDLNGKLLILGCNKKIYHGFLTLIRI